MAHPPFTVIDHVQLAMPAGGENAARQFYCSLLGLAEIPKPAELAKRGGCWFQSGSVQIHLGVENDFRPAKKAHPALCCRDYDALVERLQGAGVEISRADDIPGVRRCHIHDPFGNRIELISSIAASLSLRYNLSVRFHKFQGWEHAPVFCRSDLFVVLRRVGVRSDLIA